MSSDLLPDLNPNTKSVSSLMMLPVNAEQLSRLVTEMAELLESATSPEEFHERYLDRVVQLTGAVGGAVWQRSPRGKFKVVHELSLSELHLDAVEGGWASHDLLLEDAALQAKSSWVPRSNRDGDNVSAKANLSPYALLLAPILVEQKIVGFVELFLEAAQDKKTKRVLLRLATELAGFAAAFYHKHQWRTMQDQHQLWKNLESFAVRIHKTLDPHEVAYLTVNDAKSLLECDQLSVGLRQGNGFEVSAISGAVRVERRSPLVRAMGVLFREVGRWGETLAYHGQRDESLPPGVTRALDDYLVQSNSNLLIAAPLLDDRVAEGTSAQQGQDLVCGVILAECFDTRSEPELLKTRMESLQTHVAPALCNALTVHRLPLKWLTAPLAQLNEGVQARGVFKVAACAVVLLLLTGLLVFLRLPLRTEANGQLVPKERRIVYSAMNGKILQVAAHHGDRVEKGQELLFVEDLETQLNVDQLSVRLSALNQQLAYLDEQLSENLPTKERSEYLTQRIKVQYELHKSKVERNLMLSEVRTPRKSPVLAPLSGQILTFDTKEKLLGKTVKVGDPLLRVAAVDGPWEVELYIPERDVGLLRDSLVGARASRVRVDLLLTSDPHRVYLGEITLAALAGETQIRNDKVVLLTRVRIVDRSLLTQLERTPVGVEVRARINCGHASAGYVWFGEIWDFLYERFLF